ncbi:hypothetical protein [Treponema peruense]|uniref:Lipoprotein n=1 Tax=Treponema peruense TaxID=2787628 RepID=A0A7T3V5Y5_9SPIR|nr:hypothetical protein [Treponema peruense]QQA02023.1 hypothetical protein IWA51_05405 [Treponema peruense]
MKKLNWLAAMAVASMALLGCENGTTDNNKPDTPDTPPVEVTEKNNIELKAIYSGWPDGAADGTYNTVDTISTVLDLGSEFDAATANAITVSMKAASWKGISALAVGFSATETIPEELETVEVKFPEGSMTLKDGAEINDALFETLASEGTALTLQLSWDKFPVEKGKFRYIILQNSKSNDWGFGSVLLTNVKATADNSERKEKEYVWVEGTLEAGKVDSSKTVATELKNEKGNEKGSVYADIGYSNPWADCYVKELKDLANLPVITALKVELTVSGITKSYGNFKMYAQALEAGNELTTDVVEITKDGTYTFILKGLDWTLKAAPESWGCNANLSNLNWYVKSDAATDDWVADEIAGITFESKVFYASN